MPPSSKHGFTNDSVLKVIADEGPFTYATLAQRLEVSRSTAQYWVETLLAAGKITTRPIQAAQPTS